MAILQKNVARNPFYFEATKEFVAEPPKQQKAERAELVAALTATINGQTFQIDETSQARIDRALGLASFYFIRQLVAAQPALQPVYDAIFKDIVVDWRTADDTNVQIDVETMGLLMEQATQKQTEVWFQF